MDIWWRDRLSIVDKNAKRQFLIWIKVSSEETISRTHFSLVSMVNLYQWEITFIRKDRLIIEKLYGSKSFVCNIYGTQQLYEISSNNLILSYITYARFMIVQMIIKCKQPLGEYMSAWARFNIKMMSYQYKKSHCGDKTILRPSYLHNGISYTGKMTSLYWIGAWWWLAACLLADRTYLDTHCSVIKMEFMVI